MRSHKSTVTTQEGDATGYLREVADHNTRGCAQILYLEMKHSVTGIDKPLNHNKKKVPAHCNDTGLPTDIATKEMHTITRKVPAHQN